MAKGKRRSVFDGPADRNGADPALDDLKDQRDKRLRLIEHCVLHEVKFEEDDANHILLARLKDILSPAMLASLEQGKEENKSRFTFVDSATFAGGDYRPTWLIPRVLVKNQPAIIGGTVKSLKTSIGVDLCVSVASGREFLGAFDVLTPRKVAIVSGESGEHTLQETANRVCIAKGITLAALGDRLHWCFTLPTLGDLTVMTDFANEMKSLGVEVVFIDPLYLALGAVDAKSVFEMGEVLKVAARVLLAVGITPVIAHHANKTLKIGEPMELADLAYSGTDAFARQWLLLNRRETYQNDGAHDLWLRIGGSVGHGGLWSLRVDEGITDANFAGRRWDVKLLTTNEVHADRLERREAERQDLAAKKAAHEQAAVLLAIDAEMTIHGAATKTRIKERTRYGTPKVTETLEGLIEEGVIEEVLFEKAAGHGAKQKAKGFKRVDQ